jgi:hypothetical protein
VLGDDGLHNFGGHGRIGFLDFLGYLYGHFRSNFSSNGQRLDDRGCYFGSDNLNDFASFGLDSANAFDNVFAIGCRKCAFLGNNVNGSSGNEVAVNTDNRAVNEFVVSEGLLLSSVRRDSIAFFRFIVSWICS